MPSTTQIRGILLQEMIAVLQKDFGWSAHANKALLPAEMAAKLQTNSLVGMAWYDIKWATSMMQAAVAQAPTNPTMPRVVGRKCIQNLMSGIHKVLIGFLTMNKLAGHAERIFSKYYLGGRLEVTQATGKASIKFIGYRDMTEYQWMAVIGGFEMAFSLIHAQDLKIEYARTDRIVLDPTMEVTWSQN